MPALSDAAMLSDCAGHKFDGEALQAHIDALASQLKRRFRPGTVLALLASNSTDWVMVDLAIERAGLSVIPIAEFFSSTQITSIFRRTNVLGVIHSPQWSAFVDSIGGEDASVIEPTRLVLTTLNRSARFSEVSAHEQAFKLSFTSGSTGDPAGIRLPWALQWQTAQAVSDGLHAYQHQRRLVMLPLPVLLENIAGVYAGLLGGLEVMVPTAREAGLSGSNRFDAAQAIDVIRNSGADSLILLPEMLSRIVDHCQHHKISLDTLKYVAVGGARLAAGLIERARAIGIPAYEGYGLTEAGSVVCVNTPAADRRGSVGKALSHVKVTTSESGELLVHLKSPVHGYESQCIRTGDKGWIDTDGYVYVEGRIKNILITSFGRNISPEWVESVLIDQPEIRQAVVMGDGKPSLSAVIVPAEPQDNDRSSLVGALQRANYRLPDYAQISKVKVFADGFSQANGLATANGRPKRDLIALRFSHFMNQFEEDGEIHDVL